MRTCFAILLILAVEFSTAAAQSDARRSATVLVPGSDLSDVRDVEIDRFGNATIGPRVLPPPAAAPDPTLPSLPPLHSNDVYSNMIGGALPRR